MDKNEMEKLIENTLNSEKPNKNVLCAAKAVIINKSKRPKFRLVYGFASCAIVAITIGIFLFFSAPSAFMSASNIMSKIKIIAAIILITLGAVFSVTAIVLAVKYIKRK